ncbi:MAG: 8-oxo-dGTP diphosphatase [Halieaceae bacterium]|jgi:8-oxo-dGTP diphosphatase
MLHVAVAVIINAQGEVLLTRRHPQSHQGGFWEFPGGKVEPGETVAEALRRELREELAIDISEHRALLEIVHDYGDRLVCLDVHRVIAFTGQPRPCEGQPMRWVPGADLRAYSFPAANEPIVERLLEILA